ncbi:MAG: CCA tRNA nucleotidyltransferase [Candidatus Omnitrophica bacterium]|nr:CCA tRNA nucleotidyltransferase [Candidatus Omnitrophota bacterium]
MNNKGRGRVPVIKNGKLAGIGARIDVLEKMPRILSKMRAFVPKKLMRTINAIGGYADVAGINAFLTGGFVRDILLGVKNYDLDLVVEGDAILFAKILKEKLGGTLVVHRKFGTATLVKKWPSWLGPSIHPDSEFKIDVAAARKEKYEKPATLPVVRASSLEQDLYRRDFTINAMALKINRSDFGSFADCFGGMRDLEKGVIRILHDKSFLDDPTRIFRAVRFEQRFGFRIEKHTERLIQHAVKQEMFRRMEDQRIREELILILKERHPEKAVYRMKQLHELRFIHPDLILKRSAKRTFREARKCLKWYRVAAVRKRKIDEWLINFLIMIENLDLYQTEEVLEKFIFTNNVAMQIRSYKEQERLVRRRLSQGGKVSPSLVYRFLEPLPQEVTLCIMAKTGSGVARRRIRKFFTEYNGIDLQINGHDIKKEGISPGPRYKEILRKVLYEKLDGKLRTKKDELKYMRKVIASECGNPRKQAP